MRGKQLFSLLVTGVTALTPLQGESAPLERAERRKIPQESRANKLLKQMVVRSKKIDIPGFPGAFNPSIIGDGNGYILTFRFIPDSERLWISYIGIVLLDSSFNPASTPQVITPRAGLLNEPPSQAEDARIFAYRGELLLIYNDNHVLECPGLNERRDIYIAKLTRSGSFFEISPPVKLVHEEKYSRVLWQKNWSPFVWRDQLMITYSVDPHEVLHTDLNSGICRPSYEKGLLENRWAYGTLRGGTPALMVEGEYLAFFHSAIETKSKESRYQNMHHYYMGACTFSSEPPFAVTRMTPAPIIGKNFYSLSDLPKRVVFPGGFIVEGNKVHVAYGKDDREIWVCTIDKKMLYQALLPTK